MQPLPKLMTKSIRKEIFSRLFFVTSIQKSKSHFANVKLLVAIFFLIALLSVNTGLAQKDDGIDDNPLVGNLTGATLVNGAIDLRSFVAGNESSKAIKNIISLGIKEETTIYIPQDFTATVKVKIEYGHTLGSMVTIPEHIFTVSYNKAEGVKYNAKNYFHFKDAEFVRITVNDIATIPTPIANITNLLTLDNEMRVTRYYILSTTPADLLPASLTHTPPVAGADQLPVTWSWLPASRYTHTQLEWVWVEDELIADYKVAGVIDNNLLFQNNSTRLDLPFGKLNYNIPLLYGGTGRIYFRIRPVNIKKSGSRTDGPWSTLQSEPFQGHYNLGGPNMDSLNWQSTISFAEEGKLKAVIQYYDGSLRSRQTVTKENVNNTTVTAETFYDGQGRPAVQILPAPGIGTIIAYSKNLNRFNAAIDEDPVKYFDLHPKATPNSLTPALITSTGTSKYYSTLNTEVNIGPNNNIPDAEGYPYTVTRYTPDATGRIMAQSGVGAAMQMGKGHETKYYYGTPTQEELDGLFGTEVGVFSHYFKNMVRDANGQMSVSYVDMHGRTIATALAGERPANMIGLLPNAVQYPNQAVRYLSQDLLANGANTRKNNSIESVNTILVPAKAAYNFRYELTPDKLQLTSCTATQLCYDVMYNLEISITNESGDTLPIVRKYNNININADDNCATAIAGLKDESTQVVSNIISFSQSLDPGSYIVRKTLTISEASLQKYKNEYLAFNKGLCKTEQQLIDSVYSVMKVLSKCGIIPPADICKDCTDSLGIYTTYRTKYLTSVGNPSPVPASLDSTIKASYNAGQLHCDRLCNKTSQNLATKRQLMLADMIPYSGQYAKEAVTGTAMYNKYDIFSAAFAGQPFYKNPVNSNKVLDYYYTNFRVKDSSIHPDGTRLLLGTLSKDQFTDMFAFSWADALLPYHPEYNRLVFAEANLQPSYNWINNFNNATTWAKATDSAYLFSSSATLIDPYYVKYPADKPAMVTKVTSTYITVDGKNLSLWQIAYGNAKCKDIVAKGQRDACYQLAPKHPAATPFVAPFNALTTADKDLVWNNFKSLYANERDNQVNAYITNSVALADAPTLVNENYILQFPANNNQLAQQLNNNTGGDWSWYPATPGAAPVLTGLPAGSTEAQTYISRCNSYITQWKLALLQCEALAAKPNKDAILTEITTAMELVCQKGSNAANAYGSSNVAPASPFDGSPRSFEDVINFVYQKYAIAKDSMCHSYVIEFPKPYGMGPVFTKDVTTTLDTCNCNRFTTLKAEAVAAGKNPAILSSFNQYLTTAYSDTLTQVLLDAMTLNCPKLNAISCVDSVYTSVLNCADPVPCDCISVACVGPTRTVSCTKRICDSTGIYITLPIVQNMPAFLKCGFKVKDNCLSCAELSAFTGAFKDSIPSPYDGGPFFTGNDLSAASIRENILYAKFINYRTGFQKSWMDYAQAASAAGCNLLNYATNSGALQNVICDDTKPLTDTTGRIRYDSACHKVTMMAIAMGQNIFKARQESLLANFEAAYQAKFMALKDSFMVSDTVKEYHYTLYYYDMAGNLVKTVPPKGVQPDFTVAYTNSVKAARKNNTNLLRPHLFATNYRYNSLNQVTAQTTPDAGRSDFWYDVLGRLTVSQNAQQKLDVKYSYTIYDALGRIKEVGQKPHTTAMSPAISQDPVALANWINVTGSIKEQITNTEYDLPYPPLLAPYIEQKSLRNRVSYTYTKNLATDALHYAASFYTYDIHGNVDTLLQDYKGVVETGLTDRFKLIAYDYDLISGKVNFVSYQPGKADAFYHSYSYDAENRLTKAATSRDKMVWEEDGKYFYYKHGPLSRTLIGQQMVQGVDYAYTLQGWLKGINSSNLSPTTDIGKDGSASSVVARDVLGFALHYYDAVENGNTWKDYKTIGSPSVFASPVTASNLVSLYNGNIGAMTVNNAGLLKGPAATTNALPLFYNYRYDQLNRLVSMQAYNGLNTATNVWAPVAINDYKEAITYDPNGNILTYNRKGSPSIAGKQLEMDALTYNYIASSNKLHFVADPTPVANYTEDIDAQLTGNYTYDAIGNLKTDVKESITSIIWNVYGKITSIVKSGATISYTYDAAGNRITKTAGGKTTMYVRDATGNVMSVYEAPTGTAALKQIETHLYGSSWLGILGEQTVLSSTVNLTGGFSAATVSTFTRGEKFFEMSNHLQNVLGNCQ